MLICGVGLQVSECRSRAHFHVSPDNMLGQTYLNQPRMQLLGSTVQRLEHEKCPFQLIQPRILHFIKTAP